MLRLEKSLPSFFIYPCINFKWYWWHSKICVLMFSRFRPYLLHPIVLKTQSSGCLRQLPLSASKCFSYSFEFLNFIEQYWQFVLIVCLTLKWLLWCSASLVRVPVNWHCSSPAAHLKIKFSIFFWVYLSGILNFGEKKTFQPIKFELCLF
jgi:hypothetical protein